MKLWWLLSLPFLLAACAPMQATHGGADLGGPPREENLRAKVHTELAAQYFSLRNYAVSLQELRIALDADPAHAPAYNMLGLVYGALGEDRQAEEHFRKSISLGRNYPEAYNNYGHFLCQRGRYDESLAQFNEALKNPLYASPEKAMANAGFCALLKNDLNESERYLRRALARAPNQRLALQGMGELHLQQNNPEGARANLERLKPQGDLDAAGLWLALRVERMLGNPTAEAAYAKQLRERYPESRETRALFNGQYRTPGGMP
jgi:type IV pilus assembly protein PilF